MLTIDGWIRAQALVAGLVLLHGVVTGVTAQQPALELSLEDAIALARANNPDFLVQVSAERDADWALREAYGGLLPTAGAATGFQYIATGSPRFGVFTGGDLGLVSTPAYYLSNYSLGVNFRLSGADLYRVSREKANHEAVAARLEAAGYGLSTEITVHYLATLRAHDGVALAERELERADLNLGLARARHEVGLATELEARHAEVERGQTEVALLRARSALQVERLRLSQRMGLELADELVLISRFEVFEPVWDREDLLRRAQAGHPQLRALRAVVDATTAGTQAARSAYLPTLEMSAGWAGYTRQARDGTLLGDQAARQSLEQCETMNMLSARLTEPLPGTPMDCQAVAAETRRQVVAQNRGFPFDFKGEPLSAQLRLSLPLFTGLSRQRQVEAARTAVSDAEHRLRAEELRLTADVATAHLNVETAYQAASLETRNRELANAQLRLTRERYEAGLASFSELLDAETLVARSDRAYLAAIYAFHEGVALLEAAVGSRLAY